MAITRKLIKFDAVAKLEIVSLMDEFGATQIIQHPLAVVGYDPDAVEAAAITQMEANADRWRAEVAKRQK